MKGNHNNLNFMAQSTKELVRSGEEGERIVSCKICLSEQCYLAGGQHIIITPCKCRGNLGFVHQDCIVDWIEKKWKEGNKLIGDNEISCEICLHPIKFEVKEKYECNNLEEFKDQVRETLSLFLFMLLIIVGFLIVGIILITLLDTVRGEDNISYIITIGIAFIFLVSCSYCFVRKFFQTKKIKFSLLKKKGEDLPEGEYDKSQN